MGTTVPELERRSLTVDLPAHYDKKTLAPMVADAPMPLKPEA
jgi:hypothetical protein